MGLFDSANINDYLGIFQGISNKIKSPPFPQINIQSPGGGSIVSNPERMADFSQLSNFQNKVKSGKKGKKLSDAQRDAVLSGGPVDIFGLNFGPKITDKLKKNNALGKVRQGPVTFTADQKPQQAFDLLQDEYLKQLEQQRLLNDQINSSLLPSLLNLQQSATSGAQGLVNQGFTENSPFIQQQNQAATDAFFNSGMRDITRGFQQAIGSIDERLADDGTARSSDANRLREIGAFRPLAESVEDLGFRSQVFGRDLNDRSLGNQRAAFGTLAGSSAFNQAIPGLQAPGLPINQTLLSPTGLFSPELMLNQGQFNSNFGLQRDQLAQNPFIAGLPSAIAGASQPGFFGSVGNIFGNALGTGLGFGLGKKF